MLQQRKEVKIELPNSDPIRYSMLQQELWDHSYYSLHKPKKKPTRICSFYPICTKNETDACTFVFVTELQLFFSMNDHWCRRHQTIQPTEQFLFQQKISFFYFVICRTFGFFQLVFNASIVRGCRKLSILLFGHYINWSALSHLNNASTC